MGNLEAAENAYFGRENPKEETKQTNGDRIRSMTDEELTAFLMSAKCKACTHCRYYTDNYGCSSPRIICPDDYVRDLWRNWLASETEDKDNEDKVMHDGNQDH